IDCPQTHTPHLIHFCGGALKLPNHQQQPPDQSSDSLALYLDMEQLQPRVRIIS
ncbi:Hypothetical predicted protein, partial [Pelobates cultripes]